MTKAKERTDETEPRGSVIEHAKLTIKTLPLSKLKPHPRNPRQHPAEGSDEWNSLKASLADSYFDPLVWNRRSGLLISGHLRTKVLASMGCKRADVVVMDLSEEDHVRIMLRANVNTGEWAQDQLGELLRGMEVGEQWLAGFDGEAVTALLNELQNNADDANPYTGKIVAPVYTPKGDRPPIADLFDRTKTEQLLAGIKAAGLPSDVARFLMFAAERHTVFHFGRIAEWYCHATPEVQDLMEKSGMVIIDFKKAIEYGFVHLTEQLGALADQEEADADA